MAAPRVFVTAIGSPVSADSSIVANLRSDDAIDGNHFAGMHQQPVADSHGAHRHFLNAVIDAAMGVAGRTIDQRAQIMRGPGHRDILEHVAAGIHQRHDGAGQRLTKCEGTAHRHQRNRIDAEPPAQQVFDDRDRQSRHNGYRGKHPAEIGKVGALGNVSNNPCS